MIQMTTHALALLLQSAAELGVKQTLCQTGKLKPYLTKAQAYREFGYANIKKWIDRGLITPRKDGDHSASWRIDRLEAEALKYAMELLIYL